MKIDKILTYCSFVIVTAWIINSCSQNAESSSKPNYLFKANSNNSAGIKVGKQIISKKELFDDIKAEIYEQEKKLFELKMERIRAIVMKTLMENDPVKKGLSNDQYMDKYIAPEVKVTKQEVDAFIKKRKIPKAHETPELRTRISNFLSIDLKKRAVDKWMAAKTAKFPVEIYISKPHRPIYDVTSGNAPFTGDSNAKVEIIEFSDFQCPFCARGSKLVHDLQKKYGEKIKIAFKQFPLPFHKDAKGAAMAGLCANEQSTKDFWSLHNLMFDNQDQLSIDNLKKLAAKASLDLKKFNSCLDGKKYLAQVTKDIEYGKKVGVKSTPTFFVNGKLISGAQDISIFSELIDEEFSKR